MLRKTSAASAAIAFAMTGAALFGGAALAGGDDNTGGAGGAGGSSASECLVPVGASVGAILGKGGDVTQCNAVGGAGGAGGAGAID